MEENKSIEKMNNYVVTKSNQLIQANYKLSVVEQKIVLFLVSKIRVDDEDFKTYNLSIREFCDLLGYTGTPKYTELRKITKKMFGKVLEIWEDDKLKQMSWISYVEYKPNEGSVNISFDPRLKPYLLQLKREFTSYKLKNVMQLKSSYSIRLYEILKQWQTLKKTEITLEKLRKLLGVEDKYKEYHNFKKRVLNTAKKEINQNTDISFEFEEVKKGRMVNSICFYIKTESIPKLEIPNVEVEEQDNWFNSLYKELQILFKNYNVDGLTEKVVKGWIDQADKHWDSNEKYIKVRKIAKQSLNNTEITNPIGFITYKIKQGNEEISEKKNTSSQEVLPDWWEEFYKKKKRVD